MLNINNLNKNYGQTQVLRDFCLKTGPFGVMALMGPSGCGKSTLLRILAEVEAPTSGDIQFHLTPEKRHPRAILLFQDFALFPNMTVQKQLSFAGADVSGIRQLLQLVHLEDRMSHYPHQLSGGQKQRLALARALAAQPDLLLLDEPFSSVDDHLKQFMRRELSKIIHELEIPTIMVTHNRDDAKTMADQLAIMDAGRLVQFGKWSELYQNPSSYLSAIMSGELNVLERKNGQVVGAIRPEHIFMDSLGTEATVIHAFPEAGRYAMLVSMAGEEWKMYGDQFLREGETIRIGWKDLHAIQF